MATVIADRGATPGPKAPGSNPGGVAPAPKARGTGTAVGFRQGAFR